MIKFAAGFGCLDETEDDEVARALYAGRGDAVTGIYNALAWYMLEEVCRSYVDLLTKGELHSWHALLKKN